jgi:O-antigen/teichoic acid export membrane protein
MRRQLTWTFATELFVMASAVYMLHLAATLLGPEGFGAYTLGRRVVSFLQLPLLLGLGIAAPRFIAAARARTHDGTQSGSGPHDFAAAALVSGLVPTTLAVLLMWSAPGLTAQFLLGDGSLAPLVPALGVALLGMTVHVLVYSILRGGNQVRWANCFQLINIGVVPLAVATLTSARADSFLLGIGIGVLATSAAVIIALMGAAKRARALSPSSIATHGSILLRFGLPRVPGEFALVGLFALPSVVSAHTSGIVAAGHVSLCLSVLTLIGSAFTPASLVLLPRASAFVATGNLAGLRRILKPIVFGGLCLTVVGMLIGQVMLPWAVRIAFGEEFLVAVPALRVAMLAAIPYVAWVLMRSALEALDVRPINSVNLAIAVGTLMLLLPLARDPVQLMSALLVALVVLAALTAKALYQRLWHVPSITVREDTRVLGAHDRLAESGS